MAQLNNLKRKYDEQDPLPEALAHSESTKLFASKAATAEKQPMSPVPLISSSKKKQRTSFATPAMTSTRKEPPTDRQRRAMLATAQLTVSEPEIEERTEGEEEEEELDDIEEVGSDSESIPRQEGVALHRIRDQEEESPSGRQRHKWTADEQIA